MHNCRSLISRYSFLKFPLFRIFPVNSIQRCCSVSSVGNQRVLPDGPSLKEFIVESTASVPIEPLSLEPHPYLDPSAYKGWNRKVYFDVYGCQMNVSDTEIIWSILQSAGYLKTDSVYDADIVLLVTCAIRDNAEQKIWRRIKELRAIKMKRKPLYMNSHVKTIGVLGCMAERLKHKLVEQEKMIDLVAGPDSYKDLPRLLSLTNNDQTAINVLLSLDETYADISPVRLNQDSPSAFVSIMRGCDNMCTYCIVPFTRGRERSRPIDSILQEVKTLSEQGVKEVVLLGQNVNSYRDLSGGGSEEFTHLAKGFKTVYKSKKGGDRFARLLDDVSSVDPQMRIRFTSPHPKDFPDEVLDVISRKPNVCSSLHLPAQSGNSNVLERMRRGYTREAYLELVEHIRSLIPSITLSSDFICGFCGETDAEFEDTLSLIDHVGYHMAYLFAYSMREKTAAHRRYTDDVSEHVKGERLKEMIKVFRSRAQDLNQMFVGREEVVLVEGDSKRSSQFLAGRNDGNIKVILPAVDVPECQFSQELKSIKPGDYVNVLIEESNSQVLKGKPLYHTTL